MDGGVIGYIGKSGVAGKENDVEGRVVKVEWWEWEMEWEMEWKMKWKEEWE